jgi:hypothetical protein
MEPEGSLPHLQVPATCPYPEPALPSPYLHTPIPENPSEYYPLIYVWVSQVVSFISFIFFRFYFFLSMYIWFYSCLIM